MEQARETRRRQEEALKAGAAAAAQQRESSGSGSGDTGDESTRRSTRARGRRSEGGGHGYPFGEPLTPWIELERAWKKIEEEGGGSSSSSSVAPLDPSSVPWPPSSFVDNSESEKDNAGLRLLPSVAAAARCSLSSAWRRTARRYHPDKLGARLKATTTATNGTASVPALEEALERGAAVVAAAAREWAVLSQSR